MNENSPKKIISLVLKAVAVAMAVFIVVSRFLPASADIETQIMLLGIGLFALAVEALQNEDNVEEKA